MPPAASQPWIHQLRTSRPTDSAATPRRAGPTRWAASKWPPPSSALAEAEAPLPLDDEWTVSFVRKLQLQHARVREFLQSPGDRGLQIAADIARHIERLQAEIDALSADNAPSRADRRPLRPTSRRSTAARNS